MGPASKTASRLVSAIAGGGVGILPATKGLPALSGRIELRLLLSDNGRAMESFGFPMIFDDAQALILLVEEVCSAEAGAASAANDALDSEPSSEIAEFLEFSLAPIPIAGSLRRRSNPKACPSECFLLCSVRLRGGCSGSTKVVRGDAAADSDNGRFRLCDDRLFSHSPSFSTRLLISTDDRALDFGSLSRGAPIDGRVGRAEGGLGLPKLKTEDMLLLTEWPRIVESELSVPEEMVDSGRGMISTLSEKPTRGRDGGLTGASSTESSGEP